MKKTLTFGAALAMAAFAWGAGPATTPAKKKAPAKKPASTSAARRVPGRSVTTKPAGASASAAPRRGKKAPAPHNSTTWRNRQTTPSSDRFKEIQDALVVKGYLPSEAATGAWNQASADALKMFQAEQTLESSGKINSLSLIALGLGPRHDSAIPKTFDGNYAQPESGRN